MGVTDVRGPNLWVGVADIGSQSPTWSDRAHQRAFWFHLRRALASEPLTESRGRKERDAGPLAPTAAMKAVVQRVTRASVTGQSGGAGPGGATPDLAPCVPGQPRDSFPARSPESLCPLRPLRELGPRSLESPAGSGRSHGPALSMCLAAPSASLASVSPLWVHYKHALLGFCLFVCFFWS